MVFLLNGSPAHLVTDWLVTPGPPRMVLRHPETTFRRAPRNEIASGEHLAPPGDRPAQSRTR